MNEQTQNNRQRSRFLKIFIQNPTVNPLKQFGKHYLDRGSVHASEIGRAHAWQNSTLNPSQIGAHFVIFLQRRREKFIKRL